MKQVLLRKKDDSDRYGYTSESQIQERTAGLSFLLFRVFLLLAILWVPVDAAAKTHAFVVPGYDYKTEATKSVLETGDLSWRKLSVAGGFELYFDPNSTAGLFTIESASKGFGSLGKMVQLIITPYNYIKITGVRIYVFDDQSDGIRCGSEALSFVSGDPGYYYWKGAETQPVTLRVSSQTRNAMKFRVIEVDYESAVPGTEPGDDNKGDDNKGDDNKGDDNNGDDNKGDDNKGDDNKGDDPGNTPGENEEPTPVITFSPEANEPITPETRITLSCNVANATIYYRTDGATPKFVNSEIYREPIALSLPDNMTIRAVAVTPRGKYTSAERTYRFGAVTSIADFLNNASTDSPSSLTTRLTVVYSCPPTIYVADPTGSCIPLVTEGLTGYAPGTVFSSITGILGKDKEGYSVINLSAAPTVSSTGGPAPVASETTIDRIMTLPLHSFVALRDVTIKDGVAFSDDGRALWLDDRYHVLSSAAVNRKADLSGFVGLYGGARCLYPASVNLHNDPGDNPGNTPGDSTQKTDSCTLAVTASGGRVEVFDAINEYTRTPIGAPKELPCKIVKGKIAYAYLLPDEKKQLAGAFLDGTVVEAANPAFSETPYGLLIRVEMDKDHQLLVVFAELDGVEEINADSSAASYYTISGVSLGKERPTKAGIYLMRKGNKVEKILIR